MANASRVLIVGGTGYIGRRFVKASLASGHPTFVLFRPETVSDIEKVQMLLSFKQQGAKLLAGSFDDRESLVAALKQVDVVISAVAGHHIRHHILQQLKLVEAIADAGNIKVCCCCFTCYCGFFLVRFLNPFGTRGIVAIICTEMGVIDLEMQRFLPSEFGMDPDLMEHALAPGNIVFIDKRTVRRAIETAGIPHTYVSANMFAGYFVGSLAQLGRLMPPLDKVIIYEDGNVKGVWVDEDDVATYTVKTIDDPRTLNKTVYIRPPFNILCQNEVVEKWEQLTGKILEKTHISAEDFLKGIEDQPYPEQIGISHFYQIFFRGDLYNFEIGPNAREASELYPEVKYTTVESYLKRYL